jgi:hypothetical protein
MRMLLDPLIAELFEFVAGWMILIQKGFELSNTALLISEGACSFDNGIGAK